MHIKNYYSLIKVSQNASAEDIVERCKVIFIENHPSKNNSNVALKNFIEINEVYAVLIDSEIRQHYDYILNKYSGKEIGIDSNDLQIVDKIKNSIKKKRDDIKKILALNDTPLFNDSFDLLQLDLIQNDGVKFKELFPEGFNFPDFDIPNFDLNID